MSPEERQLLAGMFERIKANSAAPRDQEAEAFINDQIKAQPSAPYLLAQTVIVQDFALQSANQKLQQLEARVHELEVRAKAFNQLLGQPPRRRRAAGSASTSRSAARLWSTAGRPLGRGPAASSRLCAAARRRLRPARLRAARRAWRSRQRPRAAF